MTRYTGISLTRILAGTTGLVLRSLSNSTEELNRAAGRLHGAAPGTLARAGAPEPEEVLMTALTQIAVMYRERDTLPFRTRLFFTFGAVAALHVAAVVLLLSGIGSRAAQPLALGLVLTAYLAGVKHSYDWDHLAAIDNSTRKFVAQRQDPVSVGLRVQPGAQLGGGPGRRPGGGRRQRWWGSSWRTARPATWCWA